jgi:hypothetical protein
MNFVRAFSCKQCGMNFYEDGRTKQPRKKKSALAQKANNLIETDVLMVYSDSCPHPPDIPILDLATLEELSHSSWNSSFPTKSVTVNNQEITLEAFQGLSYPELDIFNCNSIGIWSVNLTEISEFQYIMTAVSSNYLLINSNNTLKIAINISNIKKAKVFKTSDTYLSIIVRTEYEILGFAFNIGDVLHGPNKFPVLLPDTSQLFCISKEFVCWDCRITGTGILEIYAVPENNQSICELYMDKECVEKFRVPGLIANVNASDLIYRKYLAIGMMNGGILVYDSKDSLSPVSFLLAGMGSKLWFPETVWLANNNRLIAAYQSVIIYNFFNPSTSILHHNLICPKNLQAWSVACTQFDQYYYAGFSDGTLIEVDYTCEERAAYAGVKKLLDISYDRPEDEKFVVPGDFEESMENYHKRFIGKRMSITVNGKPALPQSNKKLVASNAVPVQAVTVSKNFVCCGTGGGLVIVKRRREINP